MQAPFPGNRLVKGDSGIVFEVPAAVASGLVGNKTCVYADEAPSDEVSKPRRQRVKDEQSE